MPRPLTLRAQIIAGLTRLGYGPATTHRSTKYTVFIDHRAPQRLLYVGRQGALRRGLTIATSIPDDRLKLAALEAGR